MADDILVAIVGLVGVPAGILLSNYLQERRAKQRIPLRNLGQRDTALKEVYSAIVDCYWSIAEAAGHLPESMDIFKQKLLDPIQKLETSLRKNGIWLSSVHDSLWKVRGTFIQASMDIQYQMPPEVSGIPAQSHPPASETATKWNEIEHDYGAALRAFDAALGITALERTHLESTVGGVQASASTQRKSRLWGLYIAILLAFGVFAPAGIFLFLGNSAAWSITPANQLQVANIMVGFLTVDGLLLGLKTRLREALGPKEAPRANALEALQIGALTISLFWSLITMFYASFSTDLGLISGWLRASIVAFYVAVALYAGFAIVSRRYIPPQPSS